MVISGRGPRKIGQHERQHRKQDQHHASGPRAADKFPQPGKAVIEIALMPEIECSGHRSVYSVPRAARAGAPAFATQKAFHRYCYRTNAARPRTIRTSTLRVRPTAPPYHKTPVTPTTARTGRACTAFSLPRWRPIRHLRKEPGATSHKSNPTIRRPDATTRDNR